MTKFEREVLSRFAAMQVACSRWELLGHTPITKAGDVDAAIHTLVGAGLLIRVPYAETCDEHGGTRFKVSAQGFLALGVPTRRQASPPRPKNLRRDRAFSLPDFVPAENLIRAGYAPGRN